MIILNFLNKLINSLNDESIPDEGRLAIALFILSFISLMCFINVLFYFFALYIVDSKFIEEKLER
jgi:hypothetical protein